MKTNNLRISLLATYFLFTFLSFAEEISSESALTGKTYAAGASARTYITTYKEDGAKTVDTRYLDLDLRFGFLLLNNKLETGPLAGFTRRDSTKNSNTSYYIGGYGDYMFEVMQNIVVGPGMRAEYVVESGSVGDDSGYFLYPNGFVKFILPGKYSPSLNVRLGYEYQKLNGKETTGDNTLTGISSSFGIGLYF